MKSDFDAIVIGGGVIGCSILYHLAKLGMTNALLLERDELTSGSTWHAAANIHGLHDNSNITRLQHYTMDLYKALEAETGQGCGVFQPGSLYLAQTEAREHQVRLQAAKARLYGFDFHEVSLDEAERLHPLVDFEGVRCVMFEPSGGNVDPSGVTQAYAAGARAMGAEVRRFTPVTGTRRDGAGWIVETPGGEIRARWLVNAAGLWAREVAAMAGLSLPLIPTEHQYFVTEAIPEIAGMDRRLPSVADRDGEYYLRQEGRGLLVGAYERDMRFWAETGTPAGFGHELFADDLERIEPNMLRAIARVPAVGRAGIRRVVNGPMIWSPDSAALFGPVPELPRYFCCCGIIPGFSQSGGLGRLAAEWIVEGEPSMDVFAWDLARFGDWANSAFTKDRVADQYARRFSIHFPNEERPAGRPVRTRPAFEAQRRAGAVFGMSYGWEHPLWYADAPGAEESVGYERGDWHEAVGAECRTLRERAGIIDISTFARYEAKGAHAANWLDGLFANATPKSPGRMALTPLLGARGGVAGDFTLARLGEDEFLIVGSGPAERFHQRVFRNAPPPTGVSFRSATAETCGFAVAGPLSRTLLQGLTDADLSNSAFPFFRARRIMVAGAPCVALRVSFTGDLGWELHCASVDQLRLWEALLRAAGPLGAGPVGSRALASLRIEKGYGSWGREYSPELWPHEVALDGLVREEKNFLNRAAWLSVKDRAPREVLTHFEIDATTADATGGEAIFLKNGTPAGRVSSGAFGWTAGRSLAMGFLLPGLAGPGDEVDVFILGRAHGARVLERPAFDPDGARLRG